MAKKRQRGPDLTAWTMRTPRSVLDGVDELAAGAGVSRTQFVNRVLRDVVKLSKHAEDHGLFDEWQADLERALDAAFSRAMREGGIEGVMRQARESKKRIQKKGGKR